SHGGSTVSNSCGLVTRSHDVTTLSDMYGVTGRDTVTFTETDEYVNSITTTAFISIEDTTNLVLTQTAQDMTVECDGAGNGAALAAWLASNGGASASDACSGVTWSNNFTTLSDGCGLTGSATVTFTATDECGNSINTLATFTIEDTT